MSNQAELKEEAPVEDDSVAASIDAAWSEHESGADEAGDTQDDTAPVTEPEPEGEPKEVTEPEADTTGEAEEPKAETGDEPPASLSPAAREAWKDAPAALKADIAKREKDYSVGLQKNAEWAQRAKDMDQVLAPYQQYMAMNGGAKSVPDLLQTASMLQMGTPQQRAEAAAGVINQFGVDIGLLDGLLSGQASTQPAALSETEQRMNAFLNTQEQNEQTRVQSDQNQVDAGVTAFMADPKNEFAGDVRDDMADILEMSARRGIQMTMDQAYSRAVQMRPELSKIISGRTAAKEVTQRRNAASSITGAPGGTDSTASPSSLRGTIEAAFDTAGQV
jgi:hypothetical protein